MLDEHAHLMEQFKNAHRDKKAVAVVGWKASNHSKITRGLPEDKFVFYQEPPKVFSVRIGFVIRTRFLSDPQIKRVRSNPHYPKPLSPGVIKRLVEGFASVVPIHKLSKPKEAPMLVTAPISTGPQPTVAPSPFTATAPAIPAAVTDQVESTAPTAPRQEASTPEILVEKSPRMVATRAMTESAEACAFAADFVKESKARPDGALSGTEATVLLKKHFGEELKNPSRHKALLDPITIDGKKRATAYKASAKLLELAKQSTTQDVEPTDQLERVRWLVGRIPELEAAKKRLKDKLAEITRSLSDEIAEIDNGLLRCARAEEIMQASRKI